MDLEYWNLKWRISKHIESPTNLGLSFGLVNCLVVFPTHFNPNNSPLISLQISLLFLFTPALRVGVLPFARKPPVFNIVLPYVLL